MAPVFLQEDGIHFVLQCRRFARSICAIPTTRPKWAIFIPAITAATDKRCVKIEGKDRCKVAIQTNNVETDERGLHLYRPIAPTPAFTSWKLTGPARGVGRLAMMVS